MRVLTRPAKPSTWDVTVKQARADIENDVLNGKKPDFDSKEHWRAFKKDLEDVDTKMALCAYCEVSLTGGSIPWRCRALSAEGSSNGSELVQE